MATVQVRSRNSSGDRRISITKLTNIKPEILKKLSYSLIGEDATIYTIIKEVSKERNFDFSYLYPYDTMDDIIHFQDEAKFESRSMDFYRLLKGYTKIDDFVNTNIVFIDLYLYKKPKKNILLNTFNKLKKNKVLNVMEMLLALDKTVIIRAKPSKNLSSTDKEFRKIEFVINDKHNYNLWIFSNDKIKFFDDIIKIK